jgi:hypothetical protein
VGTGFSCFFLLKQRNPLQEKPNHNQPGGNKLDIFLGVRVYSAHAHNDVPYVVPTILTH